MCDDLKKLRCIIMKWCNVERIIFHTHWDTQTCVYHLVFTSCFLRHQWKCLRGQGAGQVQSRRWRPSVRSLHSRRGCLLLPPTGEHWKALEESDTLKQHHRNNPSLLSSDFQLFSKWTHLFSVKMLKASASFHEFEASDITSPQYSCLTQVSLLGRCCCLSHGPPMWTKRWVVECCERTFYCMDSSQTTFVV